MKEEFDTNEERFRYAEKKEQERIQKEYWGEDGNRLN